MYDHDDDQDMEMSETIEFPFSSVTEDSLVICGTRNSSTTIKIVKKAEHGSYRDAVVLEAFLYFTPLSDCYNASSASL